LGEVVDADEIITLAHRTRAAAAPSVSEMIPRATLLIDLISVDDFAQHELGTKAEPVPQAPAPALSSIHVA